MKTIKLISGGIDSTILADLYDGTNVYIDFGQNYAKFERQSLDKMNIDYDVITIDSKFKDTDIFVNSRNLMFASLVNMIYKPDLILMAGLKDDNCIDKTPEAFKKMSNILSEQSNHSVKVDSPFWNITKGELIYRYKDKEKLLNTFSCYNPGIKGEPCGNCPACLRKKIALETNNIKCNYDLSDEIVKSYLTKIHTYENDRISRFFIWLKSNYKVHFIDLDGILCEDKGSYSQRVPLKDNIKKLNTMKGFIVIYTARLECDRDVTLKWLNSNNVKFDCLIMNKLPYDKLIDDKTEKEIERLTNEDRE